MAMRQSPRRSSTGCATSLSSFAKKYPLAACDAAARHDRLILCASARACSIPRNARCRGLSHAKEEDTRPEHLELAVRALDRLVDLTLARAGG